MGASRHLESPSPRRSSKVARAQADDVITCCVYTLALHAHSHSDTAVAMKRVSLSLVFLVLLFAPTKSASGSGSGAEESKIPLHFIFISSNNPRLKSSGSIPAVDIALEMVEESRVLSGYSLQYTVPLDSQVS